MLVLNMRRAFNRPGSVDVTNNSVSLIVIVAQLEQRGGHGLIDDLNHASAYELLVLHQRKVRLDAGCVAVHHEAYCAGGG